MTEIYLFKKKKKKNFPYFFHFTKEIYESLHVCKWKKKRKEKEHKRNDLKDQQLLKAF